jgi:imidazolonepropionase-like amidohydrolase
VLSAQTAPTVTAIRAGRLLDPEAGRVLTNQVILIEGTKIREVGSNLQVPAGAQLIDLSQMTVLPGLVEAHNHLALTYKPVPENNIYYYTYVQESTALRAIQAASNGMQMLASGFTIVRDMGNNGNYADTALRQAIEQGWIPGPTIINSGIIIGGMGGQFFPTPEMARDHNIVYPEYLDADTPDEIVKAIRQNVLFGARVIKICVDCKPYGYTADEVRLVIREAAKSGLKVEGHVQTLNGAKNAIDAGIWSIAHSGALNEEMHKLMAQKGIWRAGTSRVARGVPANGRGAEERLRQQGAAHLFNRRRLLRRRQDARRGVPRVPQDLEGRRHPERRHPARDDDQRLQGQRDGEDARADQGRVFRRPDCRSRQPARRRGGAQTCAVRDEGRPRLQARWRDDARCLLPRRPGAWLAHSVMSRASFARRAVEVQSSTFKVQSLLRHEDDVDPEVVRVERRVRERTGDAGGGSACRDAAVPTRFSQGEAVPATTATPDRNRRTRAFAHHGAAQGKRVATAHDRAADNR